MGDALTWFLAGVCSGFTAGGLRAFILYVVGSMLRAASGSGRIPVVEE